MSDLITRARKEWCESRFGTDFPSEWATPEHSHRQCPPEVVTALLDVLENYPANRTLLDDDESPCCPTSRFAPHTKDCFVGLAEAAIARALEGKC
jgi:hypothetical protein